MRAGVEPPIQELAQIFWRAQPYFGVGEAELAANEDAQAAALNSPECSFVGEVVTEKRGRIRVLIRVLMRAGLRVSASGFIKNGGDRSAFVAARSQLKARFEVKQTKAVSLGERL